MPPRSACISLNPKSRPASPLPRRTLVPAWSTQPVPEALVERDLARGDDTRIAALHPVVDQHASPFCRPHPMSRHQVRLCATQGPQRRRCSMPQRQKDGVRADSDLQGHLVVGEPLAIAHAKLRGATVLEVLRKVHTAIGHSRLSAFSGDVKNTIVDHADELYDEVVSDGPMADHQYVPAFDLYTRAILHLSRQAGCSGNRLCSFRGGQSILQASGRLSGSRCGSSELRLQRVLISTCAF